jgi:tRNA(Ile)-lysidine synthase
MIKILGSIPKDVTLACSGGPDSMAILDFLISGKKNVKVAHFDHGTDHGKIARKFIVEYCRSKNIPIEVGICTDKKDPKKSPEEWWRDCRYDFFKRVQGTIIMGHHLNDVAEWWLFSSVNGSPKLIPYKNDRVIRPFLATSKETFVSWCNRKNVPFVNDPSNANEKYCRSRIRNNIMPEILQVNPGFLTVLEKKVRKDFKINYENV